MFLFLHFFLSFVKNFDEEVRGRLQKVEVLIGSNPHAVVANFLGGFFAENPLT